MPEIQNSYDIPLSENQPRENSMFVKCPEARLMLVVRGGDLHKIIHAVHKRRVDRNTLTFVPGNERKDNPVYPWTTVIRKLGYHFVGVPRWQKLFSYVAQWNKIDRESPTSPNYVIIAHKKERIITTPYEFQTGFKFDKVEVGGEDEDGNKTIEGRLVPIDFAISVRTEMVNPRQALMYNLDWNAVLQSYIQTYLKDFVGTKGYRSLVTEAKDVVSKEFFDYIQGKNKELKEKVGVEVCEALIISIEADKDYNEAQIALAVAQKRAEERVVTAEGEANALRKIAEGQKDAAIRESEGEAQSITNVAAARGVEIEETVVRIARAGNLAAHVNKWNRIGGITGLRTLVDQRSDGETPILVGVNSND